MVDELFVDHQGTRVTMDIVSWPWVVAALVGIAALFAGLVRLSSGIAPDEKKTDNDDFMKGDSP
jgi:hypothetical protein